MKSSCAGYPSPIAKRRDDFLGSVANELERLKEKYQQLTPESLAKNDAFISVLLQAVGIALTTHDKDKKSALRNAVVNSAMGIDVDENMQMILLRYVNDFTPLHLKVLALLNEPKEYLHQVNREFSAHMKAVSPAAMVEHAIPELHKKHEFVRIIFQDLYSYGLTHMSAEQMGEQQEMGEGQIYGSRATDMARVLLKFISDPSE